MIFDKYYGQIPVTPLFSLLMGYTYRESFSMVASMLSLALCSHRRKVFTLPPPLHDLSSSTPSLTHKHTVILSFHRLLKSSPSHSNFYSQLVYNVVRLLSIHGGRGASLSIFKIAIKTTLSQCPFLPVTVILPVKSGRSFNISRKYVKLLITYIIFIK